MIHNHYAASVLKWVDLGAGGQVIPTVSRAQNGQAKC